MIRGGNIVYITIVLTTLTVAACKNSSINSAPAAAANSCTVTSSGCVNLSGIGITGGATTTLNLVNTTVLSEYAGSFVQPSSAVLINISVAPINNIFLGTMNIQYYDASSVNHNEQFTNGTDPGNGNHYNILTVDSITGIPTYRLFFEDPAGVIIVTLQGGSNGTDTGVAGLSGNVFFRNFNAGAAPNPLYQTYVDPYTGQTFNPEPYNFCWSGKITAGPFDCRNYNVQPLTSGQYAAVLLGTFTGLDFHSALGI